MVEVRKLTELASAWYFPIAGTSPILKPNVAAWINTCVSKTKSLLFSRNGIASRKRRE
jgi:hypothetical protein